MIRPTAKRNEHSLGPDPRMPWLCAFRYHVAPLAETPMEFDQPATPVIAPALANAVFAATGRRPRRLPLKPA